MFCVLLLSICILIHNTRTYSQAKRENCFANYSFCIHFVTLLLSDLHTKLVAYLQVILTCHCSNIYLYDLH